MAGYRNLHILKALLLITSTHLSLAATPTTPTPNPIQFFTVIGERIESLGKTTLCVADRATNLDIVSQANKTFDGTVGRVKADIRGPISDELFAAVVTAVVFNNAAAMDAVDFNCAEIANYCLTSDPPPAAKALAEMGKILKAIGANLICLVANPTPEILVRISFIMRIALHIVAESDNVNNTSLDILLPVVDKILQELQQLSASCVNVAKSC